MRPPLARVFDLSRSVEVHVAGNTHFGEQAIAESGSATAGLLALGDTVTWRARHFFICQRLTSQITAFDPPHYFQDTMLRGAFHSIIYRHELERPNDEVTGIIGGNEPGAPDTWNFSIGVAKAWEAAFEETPTPRTRKVALRSAMTFGPDTGGVFDVFLSLARRGLGGTVGPGTQFVSWIHDADYIRSVIFLIERSDIAGPVNLAAPNPLPNRNFQRILRQAWGTRIGLPTTSWMVEIGTFLMRTESELVLKSRRVIPTRLIDAGFEFKFPTWPAAARDLVCRWRSGHRLSGPDPTSQC